MNQPQRLIDIFEHADGVGDDHVVERTFDILQRCRVLDVDDNELQMRMELPGPGNGLQTEVHADAVRWLKRGKRVSGAAAELQYALSRRDDELHESAVFIIILRIARTP